MLIWLLPSPSLGLWLVQRPTVSVWERLYPSKTKGEILSLHACSVNGTDLQSFDQMQTDNQIEMTPRNRPLLTWVDLPKSVLTAESWRTRRVCLGSPIAFWDCPKKLCKTKTCVLQYRRCKPKFQIGTVNMLYPMLPLLRNKTESHEKLHDQFSFSKPLFIMA